MTTILLSTGSVRIEPYPDIREMSFDLSDLGEACHNITLGEARTLITAFEDAIDRVDNPLKTYEVSTWSASQWVPVRPFTAEDAADAALKRFQGVAEKLEYDYMLIRVRELGHGEYAYFEGRGRTPETRKVEPVEI